MKKPVRSAEEITPSIRQSAEMTTRLLSARTAE